MHSTNPTPETLAAELEAIYCLYVGLVRDNAESGLGGRLLFAGEPNEFGTHLLRAANIAGAASLAASADARLLRQAMRDGAINFVVNSLDEALRILKNEIRKRRPVAVGISVAQSTLLAEMVARGVLPDLLAHQIPKEPATQESLIEAFAAQGAQWVVPAAPPIGVRFHILPIPSAWQQQTPASDAMLQDCLRPDDHLNRRWLRLAFGYLPSSARRLRSLACDHPTAANLTSRMNQSPPD